MYNNFITPASLNQRTGVGVVDYFAVGLRVSIGEKLGKSACERGTRLSGPYNLIFEVDPVLV